VKPSDRYQKIVEWSQKDDCYVGTCPGLMLGGVHGPNKAKVRRELCQAFREWIRIREEDEKFDRFVSLAARGILKRTEW
jgi:hypothetical protein